MKKSDNIIINKIQEGDISAFERLFKSYYSPLCDYAYKYVKNPHVAEDQVQDIFTNIWEKKKTGILREVSNLTYIGLPVINL
jgi:RNA polymerase sigma-70 factor (ECF subfamily)